MKWKWNVNGGVDKLNKTSAFEIRNSTPTKIWRGKVIMDKALAEMKIYADDRNNKPKYVGKLAHPKSRKRF